MNDTNDDAPVGIDELKNVSLRANADKAVEALRRMRKTAEKVDDQELSQVLGKAERDAFDLYLSRSEPW